MEPRTHYQVSFTARQAFSLFVGLLAALGLAYFFGLMTGLSGNEPQPEGAGPSATTAGAGPGAEETPAAAAGAGEHIVFPAPVTGVAAEAPRSGTPAPANIQVFEDGEAAAPALPSAALSSKPSAAAPGGFRIQVLSVSSKSEAESEAARLSKRGFSARVEPGTGPRGTVFRVRVGPYSTREEAARVSQKLAAEGRRDTWIVPPGQ